MFDFLNVRRLANKSTKPVCETTMFMFAEFRGNVKLWSLKGSSRKMPCFAALLQNLNAMELVAKDVLALGAKNVLTGRVNQDCLENFFSQVRGAWRPQIQSHSL